MRSGAVVPGPRASRKEAAALLGLHAWVRVVLAAVACRHRQLNGCHGPPMADFNKSMCIVSVALGGGMALSHSWGSS